MDTKLSTLGAGRAGPKRRRLPARLAALLLGLGIALGVAELGLRHLIFGESPWAREIGRPLRHQAHYGLGLHDDDYWKLQALLNPRARLEMNGPDPLLGWTGIIEPGTYAHPDEHRIGERRPILLFGDSNAECLTGPELCFEGLLERSELGADHVLLNYGVGGYGLDQIYLMLRAALERHAQRDPIVIVSLMVDDDLERSLLSFRGWPKPRLRVVDGVLLGPEPVLTDTRLFLERNPPAIQSYLARLVLGALQGEARRLERSAAELAELRALNRALLEAIAGELEARSLEHFFFLFYFDGALRRQLPAAWSEEIVLAFLRQRGAPYISMADVYGALCTPPWDCLLEFAPPDDPSLGGHLNDGGNRLAFAAMRQGLAGGLDPDALRLLHAQGAFAPTGERFSVQDLLGVPTRVHTRALYRCLRIERQGPHADRMLLGLRPGPGAPTRLTLELGQSRRRLQAEVRAIPNDATPCSGAPLRLRWRVDGGEWHATDHAAGGEPLALDIALGGVRQLELEVSSDAPDPECLWLALQRLRIEGE